MAKRKSDQIAALQAELEVCRAENDALHERVAQLEAELAERPPRRKKAGGQAQPVRPLFHGLLLARRDYIERDCWEKGITPKALNKATVDNLMTIWEANGSLQAKLDERNRVARGKTSFESFKAEARAWFESQLKDALKERKGRRTAGD